MPTDSKPKEDVRVSLYSRDSQGTGVAILDLETDSDGEQGTTIVVDVPRSENVHIERGETATLVFSGLDACVHACGEVIFQSENEDSIQYQFKLDEAGARDLSHLAERRRAVRFRAIAPVAVAVQDVAGGECVEGQMKDVSPTGVSVSMDSRNDPIVFSSWRLSLTIRLPGDHPDVAFIGDVRYRKLAGPRILYGIEFDSSVPGFEEQQQRLADYIKARVR